jgi:acetyl-CoA carboxylase carboxyltransferase component
VTDVAPGPAPLVHTTAEKLAELNTRLELAKEPGGEKAAAKRDAKGIPSARSRIHSLVDPGTFMEVGALAKTPNDPNALYGDGCITGHAMIGRGVLPRPDRVPGHRR